MRRELSIVLIHEVCRLCDGLVIVHVVDLFNVIDCVYQGDVGPFNPGLQTDVPLWLAVSLKQRQKCRIVAPDWMDIGN